MNTLDLPKDYSAGKTVDMNGKETSIYINIITVILMLISFFFLYLYMLNREIITIHEFITKVSFVFLLTPIYIIIHEAIHGIAIKYLSGFKVNYGVKGLCAYAGNSSAYFDKRTFIIVAMAPIIILGSVFILLSIVDHKNRFIYLVLSIINILCSIGDLFISYLALKMPSKVLINDSGTKIK